MTDHRALHSLEYFGVARQYWWNHDFLDLMSQRWRLDRVRRALDVGCGVGHWTAVLGTYLPAEAEVVGVDREEEWIKLASEAAASSESPRRAQFQQGRAESLPFPDESFDMVTCQTLLMHVADPRAVLTEMRRVLEPGGLLVIVEPNNLVQSLIATSVSVTESVDTILARVRLQLMCERGRMALGEGDFSIGDRVPAMVASLGFQHVQIFQSDKTLPLVPPYEAEEQAAMRAVLLGNAFRADSWMWSPADAKRYFLGADGGTAEEFEALWAGIERSNLRDRDAVRAGSFDRPGGRTVYLVSARK